MAETPETTEEAPEAPETTPYVDWIIPNQDKIERVFDERLKAHAAHEKADKKTSSRSRTTASDKS